MQRTVEYERGGLQKEHYAREDVVTVNCPFCCSDSFQGIYKERGELGVVRCKRCGLLFTNPRLKDPGKVYWGDPGKYFEEARMIFNGTAEHHRDPNYLSDLSVIEKFKPEGNFLDLGTNMGFFLRHTRGKKWNVVGVEPSPSLSEMARSHFGLTVKTGYLEDAGFENDFFDIVTMTDVFEHISEPKLLLAGIKKIIKPDGILFIKVPNGNFSLLKLRLARASGRLSQHDIFDSYEHVVHYSPLALKSMLEGAGFIVKKFYIGRPIQLPAWHKLVGQYYQYPSPWFLDSKNHTLRELFYWVSRVEYLLRGGKIGYFASNIIAIAEPEK